MWKLEKSQANTVARLLAPHTIEEFARVYYERKPLYIPRNDPSYYEEYFSLAALEQVLYGGEVPGQSVNVFKDGLPARVESFTRKSQRLDEGKTLNADTDVIDPDRVSALFAHGCSVVLDRVQTYSPSVRRLCRGIEWFFGHKVGVNLYLTPAGNQGFAVHYDTHDTLLLQIQGSKKWRIYGAGFDTPIDDEPRYKFNKKTVKKGEPELEIEIHAGDLLYLPRGFMHEGTANDKLSMHLTIGLYPVKWSDVLSQALVDGVFAEPLLRHVVASNARPDFANAELAEVLQRIFAPEKLAAAADQIRQRFTSDRRNNLDGQMQQLAQIQELSPESIVSIREHMLYEVEETDQGTKISFSGKGVVLAKAAAPIIHELEAVSSAPIAALTKHSENALDIVRRLIQEGFMVQDGGTRAASNAVA